MTLAATASQGFEPIGRTSGEEILYLPGDPGITYDLGDQVNLGTSAGQGGLIILATDSLAGSVGAVHKKTVCPAASTAFPLSLAPHRVDRESEQKCLVPVRVNVTPNQPIFKATFKNHKDDTVISYTAATRAIACTTGFGADDYPNGGLLYVYEGTGAGQVNVVESYDHTGGAAELLLVCHRAFATALDSTSKFIVVSGEAAATRGIMLLGGIDVADEDELDAADGSNDGDFVVFASWEKLAYYLKNLWLPVIPRQALYA